MSTTDNLSKIRSMEFYYLEGYTNTAYVNDKESFLNTYEKDTSNIPFKNCKWVDKITKEEIDCIEKVDNNYLYKKMNSMKIITMISDDFLNQYKRIEI